jgi:HAD superfamily hydrolase (TIGR01662 family)
MSLVVLDIGSTLVTGPSSGPASRIARRLGLGDEQRRALHHALMTMPFASPREVAAFAGLALEAVEEVWAAQEQEAEPMPGAREALIRLADDGVRLALISNIWQPYLTSVERHLGDLFEAHMEPRLRLFSFREGHAKPSPVMFERALARAGVAAEDAVMVGDSHREDIEPARALGMETVWVRSRPEKEPPAARAPGRTVESIAELVGGLALARARG